MIQNFLINLPIGFVAGSVLVYTIMKLSTRKICEGSHLIEGCGKTIYLINRYTYFEGIRAFMSKRAGFLTQEHVEQVLGEKHPKTYHRFTKFRHAQYEPVYCCLKCFEKHEAMRVANILADESYKNNPYDMRNMEDDD